MTDLIRSELRKVTATRLALGLLLAALGIVALGLGVTLWGPSAPGVDGMARSVATPGDVLDLLGILNAVTLFTLIFGVTFATSEFRHRTASTTFLAEPRRWRVCVAKAVTASVVAVAYAAVASALALGLLAVFAATDGTGLALDGDVWTFLGMTAAAAVVNGVLGVGVGAALRSQVGAIVAVLVWLFVVESLVAGLLPAVAPWTPFSLSNAMTVRGGEVAMGLAAALASAYALGALVAGTWLTERRDVA